MLALLLAGILWRAVRYLLQFPIWGDEALLATNFAWFGYGELTRRLENCQVAPLLFLWGERAAWSWLGPGMLSMRLLPFLAGIGSLLLYWRLAALMLAPRARLFAIGFLAVAIWPVSMSALLKPYSCDLFMSLVLLLLAVKWLKNPAQTSWLIWLSLLAPVALLASYPSVFIAAAVSAAMLVPAWRQGWKSRFWFAVFNLAVLAGFLLASHIAAGQLSTPTGSGVSTRDAMAEMWGDGFPPRSPFAFVWWLILRITGQMSAYPVGASNGGSIATVALCVIGARRWVRRRRWEWLILMTGPVVLGLAAAIIHKYPFGTSCRLNQHLAPAFCILAGLGLAAIIDSCPRPAQARKWTLAACAVFALIGFCGLARDIAHPYRDVGWKWMETTMGTIQKEIPADEPVVICTPREWLDIVYTWYWINDRSRKNLIWDPQNPRVPPDARLVCGFYQDFYIGGAARADTACKRLEEQLRARDPAWHLVKRKLYEYNAPKGPKVLDERCELFFFARTP